jgi:hypothetical protein
MADGEALGNKQPVRDVNSLVDTFNGLMARSQDSDERLRIMEKFETNCPALYEFVARVDEVERQVVEEEGRSISGYDDQKTPEESEYTLLAYGILLGFLTLNENDELQKMIRQFDL